MNICSILHKKRTRRKFENNQKESWRFVGRKNDITAPISTLDFEIQDKARPKLTEDVRFGKTVPVFKGSNYQVRVPLHLNRLFLHDGDYLP